MQKRLQFRLLGPPLILLDGEPIVGLKSRTAEALLIYLVDQQRPLSRQYLADFFWDERDPKQANANLRAVLSMLRKSLSDFLDITRQSIALKPDADFWMDTAVLETELAHLEPTLQNENPLPTNQIEPLKNALNLYQGDFLEGFYLTESRGFEEWMLLARERIERQVVVGMRKLVEHYLAVGDYAAGKQLAARWLAIDSYDENAHRQMMWLLARTGQRSAALQQYETCCRILDEEVGVPPAPATTALYERLRQLTLPPPHNLPAESTPFVGREAELAEVVTLLTDPACRLLSLLGQGGIGKTRLALQAARQIALRATAVFLDGVFFVPLAALPTPDFLTTSLADALGIFFQGADPPHKQLLNHLQERELLLVLDNFEHLVDASSLQWLRSILDQAAEVKVIVTSRTRLGLPQERIFDLHGLDFDTAACVENDDPSACSAVQLFLYHAQRVRPDFEPVAEDYTAILDLCQLVEGLPLGIELAATWVRLISCSEIVQRVRTNIDLLKSDTVGGNGRSRSIRATFDYSWQALNDDERRALRLLSAFHGPFRAKSAEAVVGLDLPLLSRLTDRSMLQSNGNNLFDMHPLLSQYCTEKLATNEEEARQTAAKHAAFYSRFLQERADVLQTAQRKGQNPRSELAAIRAEIDNVRGSWQWLQANADQFSETAVYDFVQHYGIFLAYESWYQESVALYSAALEQFNPDQLMQGRWLRQLATAYLGLGNANQAELIFKQSLHTLGEPLPSAELTLQSALLLQMGRQLAYRLLPKRPLRPNKKRALLLEAIQAYDTVSRVYYYNGKRAAYAYCTLRALNLAEKIRELPVLARNYSNLCIGLAFVGRHDWADYYHREAHAIAATIDDVPSKAYTYLVTGAYDGMIGAWDRAQESLTKALSIYAKLGDRQQWGEGMALLNTNMFAQGKFEEVLASWQTLEVEAEKAGNRLHRAWANTGRGGTLLVLGHTEQAALTLRKSTNLMADLNLPQNLMSLHGFLAIVHLRQGKWQQAVASADVVLQLKEKVAATFTTIVVAFESASLVYLTLLEQPENQLATNGFDRQTLLVKTDDVTKSLLDFSRAVLAGRPRAYLSRGLYLWAIGKQQQAQQHWQMAKTAAEELKMPYDKARALYEIGRHLETADSQRNKLLTQAKQAFIELGAVFDADKIIN